MSEKRYTVREQSLIDLANVVREKTGTTTQYDIDDMVLAIDSVGLPELEELYTEENGVFTPTAYGFSKVTVNTPVYRNFEEVEF